MSHAHALVERLRDNGLKLTPQRRLICRLIAENDAHPTVEELHDLATAEMPGVSLKTVYSTLYELAGLQAIRLVNVGIGGFRVESNLDPHSHFVCRHCGQVVDVPMDPAAEAEPALLKEFDFEVEQKEVIFRGICGTCSHNAGEGVSR